MDEELEQLDPQPNKPSVVRRSPHEEEEAAAAAAAAAPTTPLDMPVEPGEPLYCICRKPFFGNMILCDNPEVSSLSHEYLNAKPPPSSHLTRRPPQRCSARCNGGTTAVRGSQRSRRRPICGCVRTAVRTGRGGCRSRRSTNSARLLRRGRGRRRRRRRRVGRSETTTRFDQDLSVGCGLRR